MLNFIDNSFNINQISDYNLSIQIGIDVFSFCVYNNVQKKHVVLKDCYYRESPLSIGDLTAELSQLLKTEPILQHFNKCSCIFVSPINTLIPEEIFVEENLRDSLNFVSPMQDLEEIHFKYLDSLKAYLVYKLYTPLVVVVKSCFNTTNFYNPTYVMYSHACSNLEGDAAHLDFNNNNMSVLLFKEDLLKLSNTFTIKSEEDILYYLGAIITEHNLKQNIKIYISGTIVRENFKNIYKYFPNIILKENSRMALLISKDSTSRLYNLLHLSECE